MELKIDGLRLAVHLVLAYLALPARRRDWMVQNSGMTADLGTTVIWHWILSIGFS